MAPINKIIGFVGAGNMAKGIAAAMLEAGVILPEQIIVSAPSENNFAFWKEKGIATTHNNTTVVEKSDVVVLAMKPQYLDNAITSLVTPPDGKLLISILVGVPIQNINEKICSHFHYTSRQWRVVRTLPNPCITVGAGITAYCVQEPAAPEDIQMVKSIFSPGGECELLPENLMNAASALFGSGSVYVYLMIEAMCDGAVKVGLPRAQANRLAAQTVLGAAKLVRDSGRHPGQLKDEACSPGGTTIVGIHELEKAGVRAAFMSAVEAATIRSFEIGKNSS